MRFAKRVEKHCRILVRFLAESDPHFCTSREFNQKSHTRLDDQGEPNKVCTIFFRYSSSDKLQNKVLQNNKFGCKTTPSVGFVDPNATLCNSMMDPFLPMSLQGFSAVGCALVACGPLLAAYGSHIPPLTCKILVSTCPNQDFDVFFCLANSQTLPLKCGTLNFILDGLETTMCPLLCVQE